MADSGPNGRAGYQEFVSEFQRFVCDAVPEGARVLVVSKGDYRLLDLDSAEAWHFPQRADGVYAGFYPPDSRAAIEHLETLRERGAEFLAFPAAALWWLEHYREFGEHVRRAAGRVVEEADTGVIYELAGSRLTDERGEEDALPAGAGGGAGPEGTDRVSNPPGDDETRSTVELLSESSLTDLRTLIDTEYYGAQAERTFRSEDEALQHYLASGAHLGFDPHPLFATRWYALRYLGSRSPTRRPGRRTAPSFRENPLVHFVERSGTELQDPSPYFDTSYYYAHVPELQQRGVNALAHYVRSAMTNDGSHPNALFRDGFYLRTYPDVAHHARTPLEHFLRFGAAEGRFASEVHRNMMNQVHAASSGLFRGKWTTGTVLCFTREAHPPARASMERLAVALEVEHHLGPVLVYLGAESARRSGTLAVADYSLASDVLRAAAVRLLARALTALRPQFAVTDTPGIVEPLATAGVATYFLARDESPTPVREDLVEACERAQRVLVSSSSTLRSLQEQVGWYPANVATYAPGRDARDGADRLMSLATRDLGLEHQEPRRGRPPGRKPTRVVIPCSDWSVSGVNASLEAVGQELARRGWELEILFTRNKPWVLETAGEVEHMPSLPYRYLRRSKRGPVGLWEALIADVEMHAPCILLLGYDFLGNSVVPALTEDVGAVVWMQADDGDYYEQVYRLGRYCNAIVCVSEHISEKVAALNPAIGERTLVIHNSSVRDADITRRRRRRGKVMRLVYAGRLVQYQKRVLDFTALASALDGTGIPYEISLIGNFSKFDKTQESFERAASSHLEDGRIKLLGRLPRERILDELSVHDFFVLLSEFEGLPLALGEAMARGCVPIVASSPSGVPEMISSGDNGFIVEGRDYDEWARLLAGLWDDHERLRAMSQRARATVRDRFTVERVGLQFDELLQEVAGEIQSDDYRRPPSLHWGEERSPAGDVLPPPNLHRPGTIRMPGLD